MHFVPFESGRTHPYGGVADGESNVGVAKVKGGPQAPTTRSPSGIGQILASRDSILELVVQVIR
jgi:hypothetical protein